MKKISKKTRKRFIIYPKFQHTLLFAILSIIILAFIAVGAQTYLVYKKVVQMALDANIPTDHLYYSFIDGQFAMIGKYMLASMAGAVALAAILIIFLSHHLVGPIVRLKTHFEEMKKTGEIKEIKFRQNDFFQDLSWTINQAMKKIKKNK